MASASHSSRIILNLTEGTYFEYSGNHEITLANLFENIDLGGSKWGSEWLTGSRWNSLDKIVFVPENKQVKQYVKHVYEKISLE